MSIENHNPLNLTYRPQDAWEGLDTPPNEGRFCRFIAPQYAYRACYKEFLNYLKAGHDTVPKFIRTWSTTDQSSYVVNVLRWGYFKAAQVLTPADALPLFRAMTRQEDGSDPYPDSIIQEGIDMAQENSVAEKPQGIVAKVQAHVGNNLKVYAGGGVAAFVSTLILNELQQRFHVTMFSFETEAIPIIVLWVVAHVFPKGVPDQS